MIRTLKFALHYQPANSQAIGYYATQQNAAYNAAVDAQPGAGPAQAQRSASPRRHQQEDHRRQTMSSRQCGFTVTLRAHQNLKFLDLVPVKNYGTRTPLGRRHYCLHVQVAVPEPVPIESVDIENPADILGADRGTKNHLSGRPPSPKRESNPVVGPRASDPHPITANARVTKATAITGILSSLIPERLRHVCQQLPAT